MSIRKFRAARVKTITASQHVGQYGDIFYDEATGQFRVSDGVTPGGHIVQTTLDLTNGTADIFVNNVIVNGTSTTINNIVSNNESTLTGVLTVTGNASFTGNTIFTGNTDIVGPMKIIGDRTVTGNSNISGTSNFIGNTVFTGNTTFVGPITNTGPRTSIGDTTFTGNVTTTGNLFVNGPSQFTGDTIFIGNVTEVGNLTITGRAINNGPSIFNGNMTITGEAILTGNISVTGNSIQTGISKYIVSTNASNYGALEITGNVQGLVQPPALPGVMLHVTGQDNGTTPGRVYIDSNQQYSILVGRRFNGTIANPTQAQAGDEVFRLAGTGYPTGGWPISGLAQIRFIADEAQTQTNRGGHLDFLTVPIGSNVMTSVMTVSATVGANIVNNLNVTGNITAGNVTATNFFGTATRVSSNLTAGYGLTMSSGTTYNGSTALTINKYDSVTGPVSPTGAGANGWTYTLDLGAATGTVIVDPGGAFTGTVTLNGTPVAGKLVRFIVLNMAGAPKITVSGLTATNSTNGTNQFAALSGNQSSGIVEFICTTAALSGVYMSLPGAK